MSQTPGQRMYQAISSGNAEEVRQILTEHPEQLHEYPGVAPSWFHYAARKGHLAIIDIFLAAGLEVDHCFNLGVETPLHCAVAFSQLNAAKYLLSLKADPNRSRSLISAINAKTNNFELVKLLVEYGADVNQCWRWGEEESGFLFNALSWAIDGEHDEIAKLLRAHGAVLPPEDHPKPVESPRSINEEVTHYFKQHFGPVKPLALTEILPSEFPVAIHVIPPNDDHDYYTLFTNGMSQHPMTVPLGEEHFRYAELVIHLPANWKLSREALQEDQWRWPIDWLRNVAAYPHNKKTWFGGPIAVFANVKPPKVMVSACPFSAVLLAASYDDLDPIPLADDNIVQIYTVLPLFREERELKNKKGLPELFRRLDRYGISKVVDTSRRNVGID